MRSVCLAILVFLGRKGPDGASLHMKIFTSPFKNPYINLALEDYFLRHSDDLPMIFFYVNRPCVVYGRFQNPWLESDLHTLNQYDIWPVRRQSGGGSVFHDEGNLNFCYIVPRSRIDKTEFSLLMIQALARADIKLSLSQRNDLWISDHDGHLKKISGSAYKQTKSSSFHHGTFLVSSDLALLERCLKSTLHSSSSVSIPSVRSQVASLQQFFPRMEIPDVIELVEEHLKETHQFEGIHKINETFIQKKHVLENFHALRDWSWLWGETPMFEIESLQGLIKVKKGIVLNHSKTFELASMKNYFSDEDLLKMFPDFSEQSTSSSQIF